MIKVAVGNVPFIRLPLETLPTGRKLSRSSSTPNPNTSSSESLHIKSSLGSLQETVSGDYFYHKAHMNYHSVCPLVGGTRDPPPPLPQASVPPRHQRGGGQTRLRVRGWGESKFRRLEKKLSTLPTLWFQLYKTVFLNRNAQAVYDRTGSRL